MESGWKFDDVALYSYTPLNTSNILAKKLRERLPNVNSIYDACACIGGNAIGFAKHGFKVYATEIDPERYKLLAHNIKHEAQKIKHKQDDCFNNFLTVPAELVFIDAPWEGGQEYRKLKKFNLDSLVFQDPSKNIRIAFELIKRNPHVKWVLLKVPIKFYQKDFKAVEWFMFHKHKYCLLDASTL